MQKNQNFLRTKSSLPLAVTDSCCITRHLQEAARLDIAKGHFAVAFLLQQKRTMVWDTEICPSCISVIFFLIMESSFQDCFFELGQISIVKGYRKAKSNECPRNQQETVGTVNSLGENTSWSVHRERVDGIVRTLIGPSALLAREPGLAAYSTSHSRSLLMGTLQAAGSQPPV